MNRPTREHFKRNPPPTRRSRIPGCLLPILQRARAYRRTAWKWLTRSKFATPEPKWPKEPREYTMGSPKQVAVAFCSSSEELRKWRVTNVHTPSVSSSSPPSGREERQKPRHAIQKSIPTISPPFNPQNSSSESGEHFSPRLTTYPPNSELSHKPKTTENRLYPHPRHPVEVRGIKSSSNNTCRPAKPRIHRKPVYSDREYNPLFGPSSDDSMRARMGSEPSESSNNPRNYSSMHANMGSEASDGTRIPTGSQPSNESLRAHMGSEPSDESSGHPSNDMHANPVSDYGCSSEDIGKSGHEGNGIMFSQAGDPSSLGQVLMAGDAARGRRPRSNPARSLMRYGILDIGDAEWGMNSI
ncbi:hypothetical protein BDW62DRAFT_203408 [Aspergillus aurantiobrunneus]